MNVPIVLLGTVARSLKSRLFDAVSSYELVEAVMKRYNFRSSPTPEQILAAEPVNFLHGELKQGTRLIIIDQLAVAYVGDRSTTVAATTKSSTDDADFFLRDLLDWAGRKYGVDTSEILPPYYLSQLEATLTVPLSSHFAHLQDIGRAIMNCVNAYGFNTPVFELSGLSMHVDNKKQEVPIYTAFSIERRLGASYEDNKYFSQAPLQTRDHTAILAELERILSAQ